MFVANLGKRVLFHESRLWLSVMDGWLVISCKKTSCCFLSSSLATALAEFSASHAAALTAYHAALAAYHAALAAAHTTAFAAYHAAALEAELAASHAAAFAEFNFSSLTKPSANCSATST